MEEKFYTSTEAAQITRCSRRQLQYWRDKGVIVPTVNTTGKGRNVYYSISDLLALTVMHYLLSIGLSFEVSREGLEILREKESWIFDEFIPQDMMKRLMFLSTGFEEQSLTLAEFDKQIAMEAICQGQTVIPFCGKSIHQQLWENLKSFSS